MIGVVITWPRTAEGHNRRWTTYGGVPIHGGTPSSLDGFCERENPIVRWMTWGYPYLRKPPYGIIMDEHMEHVAII